MDQEARAALEAGIRQACDAGELDRGATLALEAYGREILELLCALHRNEADAAEAFSLFAEALWQGLPRFSWRSSLRTWAYGIARNVSLRHRRDARRRAKRFVPMPAEMAELLAQVRSETRSYLRTAQRSKISELRLSLPAEDQLLLLLRVERGLAWDELARVFADEGTPLARESARLRKRFQLVKERLRALSRDANVARAADED